jgi:TFIIF-interacting CTD phosphatase-like protein
MYLYVRPGLLDFLEEVSQHFELILFNNGSRAYTDAVLK